MNEKQLEIIYHAEKLFVRNGFDGTSIRDIAKEANVNIAMISYYFGSKEKLLEAIFIYKIEVFYQKINEVVVFVETDSALETLKKFINHFIKTMNLNPGLYQFLSIEAGIKKRLMVSPTFIKFKEFNFSMVQKVLEKGFKDGSFTYNDPVLISATINGTFLNFQMNQVFLKQQLNITSDEEYSLYIENNLSNHIFKTIKALLLNEE